MTTNSQRYHITTFGCQMNKADSERMAGVLEEMGFDFTEDPNDANVILYNTCTIRDNAEQKVYSYLGRQAKRKQKELTQKTKKLKKNLFFVFFLCCPEKLKYVLGVKE